MGGMKRFLAVPILGAVLLMAAACGASTQAPGVARASGSPSPSSSAGASQLSTSDKQRLWLQYASCLRQHGGNEPDPTFNGSGDPQWTVNLKVMPRAAQDACAPILQSLGLNTSQPPSAARLAALTRFAQCIRQHGVADFPDPDSQGNYPTHGDPTTEAGWAVAYQACKSLEPQGKS
jgi:hypothetical protein